MCYVLCTYSLHVMIVCCTYPVCVFDLSSAYPDCIFYTFHLYTLSISRHCLVFSVNQNQDLPLVQSQVVCLDLQSFLQLKMTSVGSFLCKVTVLVETKNQIKIPVSFKLFFTVWTQALENGLKLCLPN